MKYFGIEIYDGIPLKEILLEENESLENQWMYLTEDITCIDYLINEFSFSIDVGWYSGVGNHSSSHFRTIIIEGDMTQGGVFYEKFSYTIEQLKSDIIEAVELIQSFKSLRKEDIVNRAVR